MNFFRKNDFRTQEEKDQTLILLNKNVNFLSKDLLFTKDMIKNMEETIISSIMCNHIDIDILDSENTEDRVYHYILSNYDLEEYYDEYLEAKQKWNNKVGFSLVIEQK